MDVPGLVNQLGFPIAITVILLMAIGIGARQIWEFVQVRVTETRQDMLQARAEVTQAHENVIMARKEASEEMGKARLDFLAALRERDAQFGKQTEALERLTNAIERRNQKETPPPGGYKRRSNDS